MNPDPLTVPEEVYHRPEDGVWEVPNGGNINWNHNADMHRRIRADAVRLFGGYSHRSLYLAIGSGFLLGLGVGIVVRRG